MTGRAQRSGHRVGRARAVGLAAVVFSGLYFLSDVIETLQGGFSGVQLILTLISGAAIPLFVMGLYVAQRPEIGRLGAHQRDRLRVQLRVLHRHSRLRDRELHIRLLHTNWRHRCVNDGPRSDHGDRRGRLRAGGDPGRVLPSWTGVALAAGVVAVAATQIAPSGVQLVATRIRATAFVGMGCALLRAHTVESG